MKNNSTFYFLLSIFFALILLATYYFLFTPSVHAAVLYAGSASQTVEQGQTFVVDWFLDTENQTINTAFLNLNYTSDILVLLSADPGNSVLSLWVKPPTVNQGAGEISLIGGVPGGLNTKIAPIFRTTFRAKAAGPARLKMDSSSAVLLNDGKGTQALLTFRELNFVVTAPGTLPVEITSPTHPNAELWYQTNRAVVRFKADPAEKYSYSFSSNLDIAPDDTADETAHDIVYDNLPDGVYYFKLNSQSGAGVWQEAGIFRVQIDRTPPESFKPELGTDPNTFGGAPFLSFSTVDKTSGISYYKIKAGLLSRFHETQSPYKLSRPLIGNSIQIQAVDRAGNVRTQTTPYRGLVPLWTLASVLGLIILALLYRFRVWRMKHK